MRRALILIVIVSVLIFGGYLSLRISQQGSGTVPGLWVQTNNPEASPMQVTADKGAWFFIFAAIVLGSLVGMGATLALVTWLINRQLEVVKKKPSQGFQFSLNPATPNSLGAALTRFPVITITLVIGLLVVLSVGAAIAFGVFTPK